MERQKGFHPRQFLQKRWQAIQNKTNDMLSKDYYAFSIDDFAKLIAKHGSNPEKNKFFQRKKPATEVQIYTEIPGSYGMFLELHAYPNKKDTITYSEFAPSNLLDQRKTESVARLEAMTNRRQQVDLLRQAPWVNPKLNQAQTAAGSFFSELTTIFQQADGRRELYDSARRTAIERGENVATLLSQNYLKGLETKVEVLFPANKRDEDRMLFLQRPVRPKDIIWKNAQQVNLRDAQPWPPKYRR